MNAFSTKNLSNQQQVRMNSFAMLFAMLLLSVSVDFDHCWLTISIVSLLDLLLNQQDEQLALEQDCLDDYLTRNEDDNCHLSENLMGCWRRAFEVKYVSI